MKELLINLVVSAFNEHYIRALRDPITRQVAHQTIPEVFRVLYGYTGVQSSAVELPQSSKIQDIYSCNH